ncbi:hypothetical protein ACFPJ4_02345 [Lysinimonas soli]|uniref:DUF559 domain-containing protein n=1 Tax=Lysinimonas soli TaxID=1074233 RepID=A0ABW0NL87_9MICO
MRRPAPLPGDRADRPFAVREALEAGVPARRLRASDLAAPFHGTRIRRPLETDFTLWCRALTTVLRRGDAFTGPTAARLWGIPLPIRFVTEVALHVAHAPGTRQLRRKGVVGAARVIGARTLAVEGLPVVDPVSCWIDLARSLSVGDLVAAADFLITGEGGVGAVADAGELRARVAAIPRGHRNIRALRVAASEMRAGSWSRPESVLRWILVRSGLPEPELNQAIRIGGRLVIPDLHWPEFRLVVEYDGAHHGEAGQWAQDLARSEVLADARIRVVHVTARQLFGDPAMVVRRVARRLVDAGWRASYRVEMPENVVLEP